MPEQQSDSRDAIVTCISRSMLRQLKSENIVFALVSYSFLNAELVGFTNDDLQAIALTIAENLTSEGYGVEVHHIRPSVPFITHRFIGGLRDKQMA